MKIKIHIGEDIIDVSSQIGFALSRFPIVGEQIRVNVNDKPYQFDVANVSWDFIEDEVVIEAG